MTTNTMLPDIICQRCGTSSIAVSLSSNVSQTFYRALRMCPEITAHRLCSQYDECMMGLGQYLALRHQESLGWRKSKRSLVASGNPAVHRNQPRIHKTWLLVENAPK